MNILQISTYDNLGGAAHVAFRLHQSYKAMGLGSRMIVRQQITRDNQVFSSCGDGMIKWIEKSVTRLERSFGWQGVLYPSTFLLPFRRHYKWADVLHVHNLHGEYFNLFALPLLSLDKPVIWTLHDMWAITGHCSHSFDCERWKTGCGNCPYLSALPAVTRDSTHLMYKIKKKVLTRSNISLVAPSQWLKAKLDASLITTSCACYLIPNGVDINVFIPHSKSLLRQLYSIPLGRPVIALTVPAAKDSKTKGLEKLMEVMEQISRSEARPVFLVFGETNSLEKYHNRFQIIEYGWVQDERLMAQIMGAADLYLMTSSAENAPLSIIESMACGTPVAAFDIGGIAEIVRPPKAGFLASPGDHKGLAQIVFDLISSFGLRETMGFQAREIAVNDYSLELQAGRYRALYEQEKEKYCIKR